MKTLLITLEYPPFKGGVANYYYNIMKFWPKPDSIFVLDNNEEKLVGGKLRPEWLRAFSALAREIRNKKIEHVLVGQILPLGTVVWVLSYVFKFNYSVIIHGMDFDFALHRFRKRLITRKILKRAEKIICTNSYVAGEVSDFLENDEKVGVVNPGVEMARPEMAERIRLDREYSLAGKFTLLTISRLVKRKGHDMAIKAVLQLLEKYPDLYYYIAGTGPDEAYLRDLAQNNPHIIFIGNISDKEKWAWLSLCDAFIMPSRKIKGDYEGFGIVYLEANLMGKPVIAGQSGGVADAVLEDETGLMVKPRSVEEIASAIEALHNNIELRERLGYAGMIRAAEEFEWGRQINKMYKYLIK